ncbi:MAG TPA: hypothetical protein VMT85_03525 [Thermoanaerobaculia bacterium]|nr:hypothetical protein [Thermoanaerobaculia bacterium]
MLSIARLLIALVTLAVLFGCAPSSPADQVEEARAQTTVELISFAVREEPVASPAPEPTGDTEEGEVEGEPAGEEDAVGAEDAAGEEDVEAAATDVPVRTDVLLDLLVSSAADDPLSGITVELEHVDGDQNVKDTRLLWVPTPNLVRAVGAQVTVTVEDVDYAEGDGFSVSVRSPVPEGERSEYGEFQDLSES